MLAIIPGASPTRRARPADLCAEAQRCALALSRGGNRAGLVHSGQLFVSCCHADGRTEFAAGERNSAHMSVGTMFDRGRQVGGPGKAQEAAADRDGMPMDFLLSHFTILGVDLQWWMPWHTSTRLAVPPPQGQCAAGAHGRLISLVCVRESTQESGRGGRDAFFFAGRLRSAFYGLTLAMIASGPS
jgi:hypothetical protein